MTLVVGYADEQKAFLIGDTYFASPLEHARPADAAVRSMHGLKIHVLSDQVAVAFSGDVATAIDLVAMVKGELPEISLEVPQRLHERYLATLAAAAEPEAIRCEFLVLQLREGGHLLHHVDHVGVAQGRRAYVGDRATYARTLDLAQAPEHQMQQATGRPAGSVEAHRIGNALAELTQRANYRAVGAIAGLLTSVSNAWPYEDKLQYLQTLQSGCTPWENDVGFSLRSSNDGTRGIGLYFNAWHQGLIMIAGENRTILQPAQSDAEFVAVAATEFGMTLV